MIFEFVHKRWAWLYDYYQLSEVWEPLQQRLSSSDQGAGWRQGQSPRHWASKVWSGPACPWWSGSSRRGRACPRPGCTARSEPARSSRPNKIRFIEKAASSFLFYFYLEQKEGVSLRRKVWLALGLVRPVHNQWSKAAEGCCDLIWD